MILVLPACLGCSRQENDSLRSVAPIDPALQAQPFQSASPGACTLDGWCWESPLPHDGSINDIWGIDATSIVAVGNDGLTLHFDGNAWTAYPSFTREQLSNVVGFSSKDVFASGSNGTLLHFDGTRWAAVPSNLRGSFCGIATLSSHEILAASRDGSLVRCTNSACKLMHDRVASDCTAFWASDIDHIFIAKNKGVARFDGKSWVIDQVPQARNVRAIWGFNAKGVFLGANNGVLLRFDGERWNNIELNSKERIVDISGLSSDVFALGHLGGVFHLDGSSIQESTLGDGPQLRAIWPLDVREVIAGGEKGRLVRSSKSQVPSASRLSSDKMIGMWNRGNDVLALNERGAIFRFDGVSWHVDHPGGLTFALSTASFSPPNRLWALTADFPSGPAPAFYFDGTAWFTQAIGSSGVQSAVFALDSESAVTVGEKGSVLLHDGRAFREFPVPTKSLSNLNSVWAANSKDIFAVGVGGTILHFDGARWTKQASGTKESLNKVWGNSSNKVYALGQRGTLLRYDGEVWQRLFPGTQVNLFDISGNFDGQLILGGQSGSFFRFDGVLWESQSFTPATIDRVLIARNGDFFAISGASVLRKMAKRESDRQSP